MKMIMYVFLTYISLTVFRLESQSQANRTSDDVRDLCLIVCKYFLPYVKLAFETCFNSNTLSEMIGRLPSTVDTVDVKNKCTLNVSVFNNFLKDFVDLNVLYNDLNPGDEVANNITAESLKSTDSNSDIQPATDVQMNNNSLDSSEPQNISSPDHVH